MGVKPGYKQTGVGVIPEEWEVGSLSRFWNVTDCKHVTATFVPSGIPVASIKEVQSRVVDLANAKQTTRHFYDLLIEGGRKPQPGDLILSRNATVGEVAQVTASHPAFAMGQDVCLLRRKRPDHSSEYLQSVFQSSIIENQLSNLMVGSTFKRVNVEQIRNFVVPMPSPAEQRAIATVLSDVDALLDGLDRLIAKKRDLKQAAMQQLLTGQTRLPGFHGEWEVRQLGELAEIVMGQSPSSSNYNTQGKGLPLIQGNADVADRRTIMRVFTTQITKTGRAGDILMSVRAPVGEVSRATFDVCLGRGVCAIRFPNDFLYHCLIFLEPMWAKHSKGSTFDSVNSDDIKAAEIQLPADADEQTAIVAVLSDMDAELSALEARRDKTRDLKQAMMQELLTGRIRLV
jgi:type I restriction enzyme, S subunit